MVRRHSGAAGCSLGMTLLVLAVAAIVVVLFLQQMGRSFELFSPPKTKTQRLGPAVIQQIRAVNRLETQSYTLDGIYKAGQETGDLGDIFYKDVLVLAARAEIIAGIDLSKLRDEDISIIENTIAITLPESEILVFRMDESATRVFDRERGWLVGLGLIDSDPNLETEARRYAERQLIDDACRKGILERAAEEGRRSIERILQALEFEEIAVFAPAGPCTLHQEMRSPMSSPSIGATPGIIDTMDTPIPAERPTSVPPTSTQGGLSGTVIIVVTPTP